MICKIIEIGSELGVIIPEEEMKRLGLSVGDEIDITVEKIDSEFK